MTRTGTILDRILERTRGDLVERRRVVSEAVLREQALARPEPVAFAATLRGERVRIIAEVKRASPSRGVFAAGVDAVTVAEDYLAGGAAALSVLTDGPFFHGSLEDLERVAMRAHAGQPPVPVLRKDFIFDPYQVLEARAAGADALLLIVAALDRLQLAELLAATWELGMEALVEVHDEAELETALETGARVVGINNRDLRTFTVDLSVSERLAPRVPGDRIVVAESGIHRTSDVERLAAAGVDALLVGEALMTAPNRQAAVAELAGVEAVRCRAL
ncbi:indole-3-glycerol phosphate synthase TrpC [Thermomicrobium sp. CFH 73360]|uniref:indole-3-glycerol phosphate synthase TrpC n=1 Tax=Thermomicrobium sp. CFH 73360 TaxID=2951987 RepID=UPI0020768C1C|nr:indole-3-glycerol phosphate synthase TrpC [Thermomicrobium sp. CFH 73360]